MYLRSNCSWNIISKRLSFINDLPNIVELQRLIVISNHSAIFWRLKNFIPWIILVNMCKKYEKICHVRSIFEWKMSHISWLCITIFLHVFFCCWNLESMSTSTFFENSRFLPQNYSIDIISISLIVFVYQVEVLGYVKFRYENDIC